jgi:hypothetical protein
MSLMRSDSATPIGHEGEWPKYVEETCRLKEHDGVQPSLPAKLPVMAGPRP